MSHDEPTGAGADDAADAPHEPVPATEPSAAGEPRRPGAAPRPRVPTSRSLRKVIDAVLKGDADLDAFCHDYHPEVYRRFTDGMERDRKLTLLLQHAERQKILVDLYDAHGDTTRQHADLLKWQIERPRLPEAPLSTRLTAVLLGVAAVVVAGWLGNKLLSSPLVHASCRYGVLKAWMSWSAPFRAITPFDPQAHGIVLSGPWMATAAGDALCRSLRTVNGQDAVRCVAPAPAVDSATERLIARGAGAVVLASIDERGAAHVTPLGPLENEPLLRGPLSMDVSSETSRKLAVSVISALAHLGAPRPDFLRDDIPCPVTHADPLDGTALLALLVVPACEAVTIDARTLSSFCSAGRSDADETCALAHYLDVEQHPQDTGRVRSLLKGLRDEGPARFQTVAKLALARLDCKERALGAATAALLDLSQGATPCLLAQVSAEAACVLAASGREAVDPDLESLEARTIDPKAACPRRVLARALSRRGYWRRRGGRADVALPDYERAWTLYPDPLYGLNLAQAWLERHEPEKARGVLLSLSLSPGDPPDYQVIAALLGWIAAGQLNTPSDVRQAEDALLRLLERDLPPSAPALQGPVDESLLALSCPPPASDACLYDMLRRPSWRAALRKRFGGR